jgi:hypothetical protein
VNTQFSNLVLDALADIIEFLQREAVNTDAPGLASDPTERADLLDPDLQKSGDITAPEEARR